MYIYKHIETIKLYYIKREKILTFFFSRLTFFQSILINMFFDITTLKSNFLTFKIHFYDPWEALCLGLLPLPPATQNSIPLKRGSILYRLEEYYLWLRTNTYQARMCTHRFSANAPAEFFFFGDVDGFLLFFPQSTEDDTARGAVIIYMCVCVRARTYRFVNEKKERKERKNNKICFAQK